MNFFFICSLKKNFSSLCFISWCWNSRDPFIVDMISTARFVVMLSLLNQSSRKKKIPRQRESESTLMAGLDVNPQQMQQLLSLLPGQDIFSLPIMLWLIGTLIGPVCLTSRRSTTSSWVFLGGSLLFGNLQSNVVSLSSTET